MTCPTQNLQVPPENICTAYFSAKENLKGSDSFPDCLLKHTLWAQRKLIYIYIYIFFFFKKPAEDFTGGPVVKNPYSKAGDMSLICGLGRFHIPWGN